MKNFPRFIGFRYAFAKREVRLVSVIAALSTAGITVGVAALVVVLSVFNGFSDVVTRLLVTVDPHIRITAREGKKIRDAESIVIALEHVEGIEASAPFIEEKSAMLVRGAARVVLMRGVDTTILSKISSVASTNLSGQFHLGNHSIVLGAVLADRLGIVVGDTVEIVSPEGLEYALQGIGTPRTEHFRIAGTILTQNREYDNTLVYADLSDAQSLFAFKSGEATGVELRTGSLEKALALKPELARHFPNYQVETWYDMHRNLYATMQLERWEAYIILSLIIAVACFNILGSLAMTVIQKKRDIAILKALGATARNIRSVFLWEGIAIGSAGVVLGTILGVGVCIAQQKIEFFKLDSSVYVISAMPVAMRITDVVVVALGAFFLSALAALYPATRAASVVPAEGVRWE